MKSYSICVSKVEEEDAFKDLAMELGGELSAGNTLLKFAGEMGRGLIRKWHLDAGLYMRVWNLCLSKPVEFIKEASPVFIANNGFSLLCIQTPESVELKSVNQHQQFNKVRERRFALVPDSVNAGLQFAAQQPVHVGPRYSFELTQQKVVQALTDIAIGGDHVAHLRGRSGLL